MAINPEFKVNLKGRDYVVYAGVLDAATKAGLKSLTTRVVQIPAPDNGHVAVVMARAEFEDGRVFEDVGDASPANCSAQIAAAALRMASTRGKGRVLRDAINLGETLLEELPDEEARPGREASGPQSHGDATRAGGNGAGGQQCEACGAGMTSAQVTLSQKKHAGRTLCPPCQRSAVAPVG